MMLLLHHVLRIVCMKQQLELRIEINSIVFGLGQDAVRVGIHLNRAIHLTSDGCEMQADQRLADIVI